MWELYVSFKSWFNNLGLHHKKELDAVHKKLHESKKRVKNLESDIMRRNRLAQKSRGTSYAELQRTIDKVKRTNRLGD